MNKIKRFKRSIFDRFETSKYYGSNTKILLPWKRGSIDKIYFRCFILKGFNENNDERIAYAIRINEFDSKYYILTLIDKLTKHSNYNTGYDSAELAMIACDDVLKKLGHILLTEEQTNLL